MNSTAELVLRYIPDGTQTYSKCYRAFPEGVPFAVSRGQDYWVWDGGGKCYIDWTAALGAVGLGYAYRPVVEAVHQQLLNGTIFGLPSVLEGEVAEALCEATGYEMVRFCKNGSDVTAAAVRLARAITGRNLAMKFRGHYHGCADWAQARNAKCQGIPEPVRNCTVEVTPWEFGEIAAWLKEGDVACIIIEAAQFDLPPREYLLNLRQLCDDAGTLLIFDEVINGFRLALGGVGQYYGIRPDLACFGKAIANGVPISAVMGKAEYMKHIRDVFISYTYGGDCLGLAACRATIQEYQSQPVLATMHETGAKLGAGIRQMLSYYNLPFRLQGEPWRMLLSFRGPDGHEWVNAKGHFLRSCFQGGLMTNTNFFPMYTHDQRAVDQTLAILERVFSTMAGKTEDSDYVVEGRGILQTSVRSDA